MWFAQKAKYDDAVNEIIKLAEVAVRIANDDQDIFGLTMIIPVDFAGNMYSPKSDRLQCSLLCYEDDNYFMQMALSKDVSGIKVGELFHIGTLPYIDQKHLIGETTNTFDCNYKKIIAIVNTALKEKYPSWKLEFDGSRVIIN